jgi:RimJ/RimL family protein N-acetyltransferase
MAYGWEGEKVRLVPLDYERHAENAFRWLNDPRVTDYLLVGDYPLTRLAEKEYFEMRSKPSREEVAFAIETLEGEHIGHSGIHNISWPHGTALTGVFIGRQDLWNKGFATDACRVRARYCFEVLGLRMLVSEVLQGNEASLAVLKKAGYVEYGVLPKKYWKRGQLRDATLVYLDRERWESVQD